MSRGQRIADWWNSLRVSEDPGATTWEVLDGLEREVTDCLAVEPQDMSRAESLTALAILLVAGRLNH